MPSDVKLNKNEELVQKVLISVSFIACCTIAPVLMGYTSGNIILGWILCGILTTIMLVVRFCGKSMNDWLGMKKKKKKKKHAIRTES
jgi:ABC-type microcin C transport system permease subunit YejB